MAGFLMLTFIDIFQIPAMQQAATFVNWFRNSSPYIHAHRNRTFVIFFSGQAVTDPDFDELIHDFALLKALGVRLVLVHGIRQQVDVVVGKSREDEVLHGWFMRRCSGRANRPR